MTNARIAIHIRRLAWTMRHRQPEIDAAKWLDSCALLADGLAEEFERTEPVEQAKRPGPVTRRAKRAG